MRKCDARWMAERAARGALAVAMGWGSGMAAAQEPAEPGLPIAQSEWSAWERAADQPVFTIEQGNNHDTVLFIEPDMEYPYHLIVSHEPSGADLWRAKTFSWSSDGWELVDGDYQIGGQYEYDDGVKVGDTYFIYEDGVVFTFSGPLEEASGKWEKAGTFPRDQCDDIGVYVEDGVFHIFGEHGTFPHGPDGTSLSHFTSPTGVGDWTLVNAKAVDPNPDGGDRFGVGDPTIEKIAGEYFIFCDLESKGDPYKVIGWKAKALDGPFEYLGIAIMPRRGGTDDWDNYRIQDPDIGFIPELGRYVMTCNMLDIDGSPGGDFPTLKPGWSRVVGVFYSKAQREGAGVSAFQFPTSANDSEFQFTSFPDLFNWNIKYPQPGWEDAMDWFLSGMKKDGPAFSLCAGDIMDARWWSSPDEVRERTSEYWGGFRKRFEDKGIDIYIAPGDHEYGDDHGLTLMNLAPVFASQFAGIFDMPENGPSHKKGLAYSFEKGPLAVISVDTFEDAGNRMSMTVSGDQLAWLESELERFGDKPFIIIQGHVPVIGPVASKNSSANMLEGGAESAFWKAMVKHGVDVYLCGEHHRITAGQHDGIWQVVHGGLWGTQTDPNYLRGSVWNDRLELELFELEVEYSGMPLTDQHPHRGNSGPWSEVIISERTRRTGPVSAGRLVLEETPRGTRTAEATGAFGN